MLAPFAGLRLVVRKFGVGLDSHGVTVPLATLRQRITKGKARVKPVISMKKVRHL
jgi:hypothetical protein